MAQDLQTRRARLAIAGAGAIAGSYVPVFAGSSQAELVAVCDTDHERARGLADPLGIPAFASHSRTAANRRSRRHHRLHAADLSYGACRRCVARGRARPVREAADHRRLLRRGGCSRRPKAPADLTMASKFRFAADIVRAKELVASGTIGTVVRVENAFVSDIDMTRRWNSHVPVSGGGVLIDNGTHLVDILRFLLGPLVCAYAVEMSVRSALRGMRRHNPSFRAQQFGRLRLGLAVVVASARECHGSCASMEPRELSTSDGALRTTSGSTMCWLCSARATTSAPYSRLRSRILPALYRPD